MQFSSSITSCVLGQGCLEHTSLAVPGSLCQREVPSGSISVRSWWRSTRSRNHGRLFKGQPGLHNQMQSTICGVWKTFFSPRVMRWPCGRGSCVLHRFQLFPFSRVSLKPKNTSLVPLEETVLQGPKIIKYKYSALLKGMCCVCPLSVTNTREAHTESSGIAV